MPLCSLNNTPCSPAGGQGVCLSGNIKRPLFAPAVRVLFVWRGQQHRETPKTQLNGGPHAL